MFRGKENGCNIIKGLLVNIALMLVLVINLPIQASAADIATECSQFTPYGVPTIKDNTISLCRSGYSLSLSTQGKVPVWAAYYLDKEKSIGCVVRTNSFAADSDVPVEFRVVPKDYNASGYDKGHNVNDADLSWSTYTEHQSFLMSNMSPQLPGFNRGIFKNLENQVRNWAYNDNRRLTIYVGNIWSDNPKTIGQHHVVVPDYVWKIIIDQTTGESMAFNMPNLEGLQDFRPYLVSISEIEQATGVVFPTPHTTTKGIRGPLWPIVKTDYHQNKKALCSTK